MSQNNKSMPGDEVGGGMSAFVVFSMIGFYPVTPGVPICNQTSPAFDKASIRFHNGKILKIVCPENSQANKYVQAIKWNIHPQSQVWIKPADIRNGGVLERKMGNTPNTGLGTSPADLPPSAMALNPESLGTAVQ